MTEYQHHPRIRRKSDPISRPLLPREIYVEGDPRPQLEANRPGCTHYLKWPSRFDDVYVYPHQVKLMTLPEQGAQVYDND